ncbi:hypothetical protein [Microbacterium luteum]|uniref:hypothetical protein n=1 Tax=Microbacterium TaxID=33882 RepID=UPI001886E823|nr:hypothetical protein [Microbacterium luteum]
MPTHAGPQTRAGFNAFDEAFVRCYSSAAEAATQALRAALPAVEDGVVLEGAPAFDYMIALRQGIVTAATEVAAAYDSATWLHLIRRLTPHALTFAESGTTDTQGDSRQRIAENLVGTARGDRLDAMAETVPIAVSAKLAKFMALVRLVDELEGAIRSASKGVKYKVQSTRRPAVVDSDALLDALHEFDVRTSWSSADDEIRLNKIDVDSFEGDPPMLVAFRFTHGYALDETWDGPYAAAATTEDAVQFTVRAFTTGDEKYMVLERHDVLASFDNPARVVSLIVFGNTLLRCVMFADNDAGRTLPRLGLMSLPTEDLEAQVAAALGDVDVSKWLSAHGQSSLTPGEVMDHVQGLYEAGRRSFPGPVLQDHEGRTLVDAWAYAWHVTQGLKLSPSGGLISNLTGAQFELVVQELIDGSVLAPSAELRPMRGKELRLNGSVVTDADALLVVGTKLFLISCKRFLTAVDYLAGEHAAVRSGTDRLNKALDQWQDRIATLTKNPVGDNYDFSGYEIDGFVLMPELVFTPRSDSRELLRLGHNDLFFTRAESYSQFAATLEMASWPPEPKALRAARLAEAGVRLPPHAAD